MDKPEYSPTQTGTFTGYMPEYFDNDKWKPLRTKKGKYGVPSPKAFGGILNTIHLFGYEQANALRYEFAAFCQAKGKTVKTRIVSYEITYDIKAKKIRKDNVKQ